MGITVPYAYRLKKAGDLWAVVSHVKKVGTLKTQAALNHFFLNLMECVDTTSEEYLKVSTHANGEGHARAQIVQKLMRDQYRIAVTNPERDPFDFNVWVSFRKYKKHIYVFPGCSMMLRNVLDFLGEDPRLEEFWYDNRGDKPDEIPTAEWNKRAKVWETFAYAPEFEEALHLDICSWDLWWTMNPYMDQSLSATIRNWGKPPPPSLAQAVKDAKLKN